MGEVIVIWLRNRRSAVSGLHDLSLIYLTVGDVDFCSSRALCRGWLDQKARVANIELVANLEALLVLGEHHILRSETASA